jgi:hypothetical protein
MMSAGARLSQRTRTENPPMKRTLLIAAALLLTTAIVPSDADAARRPARAVVNVTPAKVWVPAHRTWSVSLGRIITVSGNWRSPPRTGMHWVPGHHAGHGKNRRWVPGHWASNG